jgi:hypothetical protein
MEPHEKNRGEAADAIAELDALYHRAPEILPRLQARKRWLLAELEKLAAYERMLEERREEAAREEAPPAVEAAPAAAPATAAPRSPRGRKPKAAPEPMSELRTLSLPASCLLILRDAGRVVLLNEILDRLLPYRPTLSIATLRTTLLRLAKLGQLAAGRNDEGRSTYTLPPRA